jgi:hypothetical protein
MNAYIQGLMILLGALAALGAAVGLSALFGHKRFKRREAEGKLQPGETSPLDTVNVPVECCGQHATCERDSLLAAVSKEIIYYSDEELDTYRGIASDQYTDEQAEEFANVFYELREIEVAGWVRSLQLRGIELPDQIKDEVFLVVRERRFEPVSGGVDHSNDKVAS